MPAPAHRLQPCVSPLCSHGTCHKRPPSFLLPTQSANSCRKVAVTADRSCRCPTRTHCRNNLKWIQSRKFFAVTQQPSLLDCIPETHPSLHFRLINTIGCFSIVGSLHGAHELQHAACLTRVYPAFVKCVSAWCTIQVVCDPGHPSTYYCPSVCNTNPLPQALTPCAAAVLQPSTLHIHFAAVASGVTGCGGSQLTDLGLHMDACGLSRGPTLGPIWGLRMQTGERAAAGVALHSRCTVPAVHGLMSDVFCRCMPSQWRRLRRSRASVASDTAGWDSRDPCAHTSCLPAVKDRGQVAGKTIWRQEKNAMLTETQPDAPRHPVSCSITTTISAGGSSLSEHCRVRVLQADTALKGASRPRASTDISGLLLSATTPAQVAQQSADSFLKVLPFPYRLHRR